MKYSFILPGFQLIIGITLLVFGILDNVGLMTSIGCVLIGILVLIYIISFVDKMQNKRKTLEAMNPIIIINSRLKN